MPNRDGTGPRGPGGRRGRGAGRGQGRGMGRGLGGFGQSPACPSGYCVCPECGYKIAHQVGFPCNKQSCPECGTRMVRE